MKHDIAQVNWYEGVFLQPQHLQTMDRNILHREWEQVRNTAHWWGAVHLEINKNAISGYRFIIEDAKVRLKDGTWFNFPGNGDIAEKSFQDELHAVDGNLTVWLGVRRREDHVSQVHPIDEGDQGRVRPYKAVEVKVEDDNTGENEQDVQVRLLNGQIFFGDKPGDAYDAIKIAEIKLLAADRPGLDRNFIPPVLHLSASAGLKDHLNNLVITLTNQSTFLKEEMAAGRIGLTADPMELLSSLLRLQTVASAGNVFGQLLAAERIHPFEIYKELNRLVGMLTPLAVATKIDMPIYDHDNLTDCMERTFRTITAMLAGGVVVDFTQRQFDIDGDIRSCRLDADWLDSGSPVYLCIAADKSDDEVDAVLGDYRVKIGPPSKIEDMNIARVSGVACERLHRIPVGLPDRTGLHYFVLDLSSKSEYWDDLRKDLTLVITGIPVQVTPEMSLYIKVEGGDK